MRGCTLGSSMWYNSLMRRILQVVLFLSVCSRAFSLTADHLPPSSFADTEVSTNVAPKGAFVVASGDNFRYLLLDLELNATPSNTYVFAWQGVAENRDGNQLTERRIELCQNGDAIVSTNGVSSTIPYEIPFAHDGYGQDDDWVRANFTRLQRVSPSLTNAEEIISIGYTNWVAQQVGVGLLNGLYMFSAEFLEDPPEPTLLYIGDCSVCVTRAGVYSFVLP